MLHCVGVIFSPAAAILLSLFFHAALLDSYTQMNVELINSVQHQVQYENTFIKD